MTPSQSPPHEGEKKKWKILIIGAKGMLGQELVQAFQKDYEVIGWDKEEIDITEAQSARRKVQNLKPDILINAAAYNDVDRAEKELELANQVNGYAVGDLAKICNELACILVHYSTEYVFDGEKKEGYLESDQPNPLSAYGRSKFLGEEKLVKNTSKYYLIRLSRLFGKAPSPLSSPIIKISRRETRGEERKASSPPSMGGGGEGETFRKKSFVEIMLGLAQRKKEIEVVDEEISSPTYAKDLAVRTRYILQEALPHGIYHCANSGACTWYGFAKEIFKIMRINVKLIPVKAARFLRPAKRPKYGILLNTKLPPMRPWPEALKEFLTPNQS